ncbi:ATP-binding protein [Thermobifida halotolerans]|uniref:ATP-binding protein n=1 Tax=Thermobifida halotolerans TaxID=483545 RepID=A0A399G019_9ACTN|nr:ATP-binding protein [Thermobifida halotolerans]UOE21428.1 ATP-binding protein [Thermobifida halotolerans]
MRLPIRHLSGNLAWTTHGRVWAIWRVTPLSYLHSSPRAQQELHAATTALLKRLSGEPMLLSLCAQTSAADVVEAMITGVDLEACPAWVEVADATLDWLGELALAERTHWLCLPLPAERPALELRALAGATANALAGLLGLAPPPVPRREVASYEAKARRLGSQLAGQPGMRPASPAEILWIFAHSVRRGMAEPLLADTTTADQHAGGSRLVGGVLRGPSLAGLGEVRLTEGGLNTGHQQGRLSLLRRRWLHVETPDAEAYQAFLVLAEMPAAFRFPGGSEWLASLDGFAFGVDWASRLTIVPNAQAEAQSRRKARELAAQADEYDGETAGIPQALIDAAADLDDERGRLQSSRTEVEVQSTTVLCTWGTTAEEAESRAEVVRTSIAAAEYQVVRPTGGQAALFEAMLPGAPSRPLLREFTQYQLASDYAMAMPWTSTDLGDPTGALLGLNLDGGTSRPVLLDLADAPRRDASASLGVVGELGAGKSVLLKTIQIALVDRGGRVIAVDRTPMGEWAHFAAHAAPTQHQIVRADARARHSLDPLRVFGPETGARYAKSYLTLQLGVAAMSPAGLVLAQAVDTVAASARPCMRAVIDELDTLAHDEKTTSRAEHARELAGLLRVIAADRLGQIVFGDLPPLRLDKEFVVFHTSGLTLPKKEVFTSEYHMQRQPLETLIGRAVLYLVAAVAREVAFADADQFCAVALDECYWLTSSTEGQDLVLELVRDGRKHAAGAMLGSHDPSDFGSEVIRGLLANRFLLRHRDTQLAAKGLQFLNLDPHDRALVDLVTTNLSPISDQTRKGEALFLDTRRRTGRIRVVIPPVPRIATSVLTTPGRPRPDGA